ncbi:hypothetical protein [Kineosporia sp. NBRC 101731]|uniref:hypothetical protein n=1 Tax=Kineosporia sp. NBRC 101731 TaxID=3032199 RepID=UPI00249FCE1A|nr:hypothetical protein [Kineosporia sp. NBRC 101731]GLY33802.1 hypothetical protein Kisp02_71670 [Kineosporia sp. NBRC 101731]
MNHRSAALALTVALVLPVAGGTAASAAALPRATTTKVHPGDDSKVTKPVKPVKAKTVVYKGKLSAVDPAAGTITVAVRGGRDKKVRNTSLVLNVPDSVKITRNGVGVTLAQLQTGDHINVRTRQSAEATIVTRIAAEGKESEPEIEPTTPTPEPTPAA